MPSISEYVEYLILQEIITENDVDNIDTISFGVVGYEQSGASAGQVIGIQLQ